MEPASVALFACRVLLRVRLLYYLKQEVIGDQAQKVFAGVALDQIDIRPPFAEGDPPVYWWDQLADKSLLIGVFKHGRADSSELPCNRFGTQAGF